jgi:hypothetical protein
MENKGHHCNDLYESKIKAIKIRAKRDGVLILSIAS